MTTDTSELYKLMARANVLRRQALDTQEKIVGVAEDWKQKLNDAADKAKTLGEKAAIISKRELLPTS